MPSLSEDPHNARSHTTSLPHISVSSHIYVSVYVCMYTYTHTLSLTHSHTLTHSLTHSLSLSLTLSLTHSLSHSLSHSHTHTHTLSLSLTHTHIRGFRSHGKVLLVCKDENRNICQPFLFKQLCELLWTQEGEICSNKGHRIQDQQQQKRILDL